MIPRGVIWSFIFLIIWSPFFLTRAVSSKVQSEKNYDTNDWIPVTPSQRRDSRQSVANDRILDYHSSNQNFPNDKEYSHPKHPNNNLPHFSKKPSQTIYNENFKAEKINFPSPGKLKFETPPPPPSPNQQQINYYNGKDITPYLYEQPPPPPPPPAAAPSFENPTPIRTRRPQAKNQKFQTAANGQFLNQQPLIDNYAAMPNLNPEVPPRFTSTGYDQYQIPINSSFYESLNPSSINNDFYQAINNYNQLLPNVGNSGEKPQSSINQEESVQLVYVPAENLKSKSPVPQSVQILPQQQQQLNKGEHSNNVNINRLPPNYQHLNPVTQSSELVYKPQRNENYLQNKQQKLENIEQDFIRQAFHAHNLQKQFQDEINPLYQETVSTTTRPAGRSRAHQPPLAVFMESGEDIDVADVLDVLKSARSISVQDAVTPNSPKIFIGPSTLNSHPGYTKFALPYLNNVNGNRIERKIDQLPFFVAPASYRAPPGYAKIPLPSPHVGSLVASVPAAVPSVATTVAPEPSHFSRNTLNPFSLSYPDYNFDYQNTRPVQNFLNNNNNNFRYQSTPLPTISSTPFNDPLQQQNIFRNPYDLPEDNKQTSQPVKENLSVLNSNDQKHAAVSKDNRQEVTQENINVTPFKQINVNPLDVSLNNYELSQINNQLLNSNKKVKHSTTRRPQTNYESESPSSTIHPPTSSYSTERPTRGRGRGRGRARASTTTTPATTTTTTSTTTTTTTTELPIDSYFRPEDYLSDPPRGGFSTENYQQFSPKSPTESPLGFSSPSPYSIDPYLPLDDYTLDQALGKINENSKAPEGGNIDTPKADIFSRHRQYFQENLNAGQASTPSLYNLGQSTNPDDVTVGTIKATENTAQSINADYVDLPKYVTPSNLPDPKVNIKTNSPIHNHNLNLDYPVHRGVHDISTEANIKESLPSTVSEQVPIKRRKQQQINTKSPLEEFRSNVNTESKETPQEETFAKTTLPYQSYKEETNDNINDNSQVFQTETGQQQFPADNSPKIPHNLFRPNFDETYISLQDQAVRSLLSPIAPAAEEDIANPTTPSYKTVTASTNTYTESPAVRDIDTTTRAPTRVRTRGRVRPTTTTFSETASSTPRSVNRKRPTSARSSGERISSTTESFNSGEDFGRFVTNRRRVVKTRPRLQQNDIHERISSTTENYAKTNKASEFENEFRGLSSREFDHSGEHQSITPADRSAEIKDYSDLYSLDKQSTATPNEKDSIHRFGQGFQTTNASPSSVVNDGNNLNPGGVDGSASYNVPVQSKSRPDIITKSDEISDQYVKYDANVRPSGGIIPNTPDSVTKPPRGRGRTRIRTRVPTSTTKRPTTIHRVSTSPAPPSSTTTEDHEEFYGFIRHPNFKSQLSIAPPTKAAERKPVQFVGEIKPKYSINKSTTASITEDSISTEAPRQRIRSRTRAPTRKTSSSYRQSDEDVDQNTRRANPTVNTRSRGRGSSHYKPPDNVKRDNDDEDVADQNYPVNFLQLLDPTATPKLTPSSFQITVEPIHDEDNLDEDQVSHSSYTVTKHLPAPEGWSNPNALPSENKSTTPHVLLRSSTSEQPSESTTEKSESSTEVVEALPIVRLTSETIEEQTADDVTTMKIEEKEQSAEAERQKKKHRRKGVWKLVKQQPVDPLEGSESQSYHTVINSFETLNKIDKKEKVIPLNKEQQILEEHEEKQDENSEDEKQEDNFEVQETTTNAALIDEQTVTTSIITSQDTFFDKIYEMFGLINKQAQSNLDTSKNETTDTNNKETIIENESDKISPDENTEFPATTTIISSSTSKKYEVEPWEMKAVKMLTSTEVTHETEICYKGRCIKSKEKKLQT